LEVSTKPGELQPNIVLSSDIARKQQIAAARVRQCHSEEKVLKSAAQNAKRRIAVKVEKEQVGVPGRSALSNPLVAGQKGILLGKAF
jgi:hypothetical protein